MTQQSMLPLWALYMQAFLAPVLALVAAGVAAWVTYRIQQNQIRIARDKLKLDLFDRRYKILEDTLDLLSTIMRDGKSDWERQRQFHDRVLEARFLFKEPTVVWLRSIESDAEELLRLEKKAYELGKIYDRSIQEQRRLEETLDSVEKRRFQLLESLKELQGRFAPYLSLADVAS